MLFCSVLWIDTEVQAKYMAPLLEIVKLYREVKKINHPWYVLVLYGADYLQSDMEELASFGCYVINVNSLYEEIKQDLSTLYSSVPNSFIFNNLIRWIICYRYFDMQSFLHSDIDLILNDEPENIITAGRSLYMGSTCMVYLDNPKYFASIYDDAISHMNIDGDGFLSMVKNSVPSPTAWDISISSFINEEQLFYYLINKYNLSYYDTSNRHIFIPFIPEMYDFNSGNILHGKTVTMMAPLKGIHNKYEFNHSNKKHYINNIPMAYMHYQYLLRSILFYYNLQKELHIPQHLMYCPDLTVYRIEDIEKRSLLDYRKDSYKDNFINDLVLRELIGFFDTVRSCPGMPGDDGTQYCTNIKTNISMLNSLYFEKEGLADIFNNSFWFSKNVFA